MTKDEDNLELKRILNKMTCAEIKGLALYMCDDELRQVLSVIIRNMTNEQFGILWAKMTWNDNASLMGEDEGDKK